MHDVLTSDIIRSAETSAVPHRVLTLPGDLTHPHLLQLAYCSVPQGRELEIFTLGDGDVVVTHGVPAPDERPRYGAEQVSRVLRAVHMLRANALVLGYPGGARGRSHFTDVVERVTAAADLDVVVCVERHERPWRRVLVPFLHASFDDAALGVARRLARAGDVEVTVLHAIERNDPRRDPDVPAPGIGSCALRVVAADDPVTAAAEEARRGYDVIVLGGRQPRLGRGRYFTMRQQRLLLATDASLVIVHAGRPAGRS